MSGGQELPRAKAYYQAPDESCFYCEFESDVEMPDMLDMLRRETVQMYGELMARTYGEAPAEQGIE